MDLGRIISELEAEKQRLDEAILALERLSAGKANRRGRPPRAAKEEGNGDLPSAEQNAGPTAGEPQAV